MLSDLGAFLLLVVLQLYRIMAEQMSPTARRSLRKRKTSLYQDILFPRSDYRNALIAPPPYRPGDYLNECLFAARQASRAWRTAIENDSESAHKAPGHVNDTCFALAVFDKVYELYVELCA